jgi:hypothetical protein
MQTAIRMALAAFPKATASYAGWPLLVMLPAAVAPAAAAGQERLLVACCIVTSIWHVRYRRSSVVTYCQTAVS